MSSKLYHIVKSRGFSVVWLEENFSYAWRLLAQAMRQNLRDKTIVFSMKLLGMHLIINGYTNFSFKGIPVPVDYRVRELTKKILDDYNLSDEKIRVFWDIVLEMIREKQKMVTMIHLDSLLWQIGDKKPVEIKRYFESLGEKSIGEDFVNLLTKNYFEEGGK